MSLSIRGSVFDIQKFCVSDGPGIRTTVFFKGCPLTCLWCHNPESKKMSPELSFNDDRCTLCRSCVEVCPVGAHVFENGRHAVRRHVCRACGLCETVCLSGAVEKIGRLVTVDDVMEEVLKDRVFYRDGGGMTFSGGEPLMQHDFALALLEAAKEKNINTCLETCGYVKRERLLQAVSLTDWFLYDYKLTDQKLHKRYTGVDNATIIANLFEIDRIGARTVLRCPIIPGINDHDGHFSGVAALANRLRHLVEIDLMPYHPLGESKSAHLARSYPLDNTPIPTDEAVALWMAKIQSKTGVAVKRG